MAPGKHWRRPYSAIYSDNYIFGGSLYSEALASVGMKPEIVTPVFPQEASPPVLPAKKEVINTEQYDKHKASMALRRVQSSVDLGRELNLYQPSDFIIDRMSKIKRRDKFTFHGEHVKHMEERKMMFQDLEKEKQQKVEEFKKSSQLSLVDPSIIETIQSQNISREMEIDDNRKQMQIEIEHLNQRLAEAESKLKTEVARIKKKMQVQITELEMSLDAANKQNLDLQRTIKKQALHITELQAHYDEVHRQLQQTIDQLGVSQRRCQGLQAELDEMRTTVEQATRAKRAAEMQCEEATARINELNTINMNLLAAKSKLEGDFTSLQNDFEEIQKELRIADERATKALSELKITKDTLVEETERLVKIESIKKSLEIEVHNLQVRIEEVEANALAGGKRVIAKLESRIRDIEIEFEEEKRRHVETQKILRKKELRMRELILQTEDDHKLINMLNDSVDKLSEKVKLYKRQLGEQEGLSQQNLTRVRRYQRELEAAEERADTAESNLNMIRAKHRTWVTTSQIPGGVRQVFVTEEQQQF